MELSEAQIEQLALGLGIDRPNEMQHKAWSSEASHMLILSPTGSGKTIAFAGALLRRLDSPSGNLQAVVLAPSRELVIQITEVMRRFAQGSKITALYGNHSMADEVNTLAIAPRIVVATPGRLLDHLQRGNIDTSAVTSLVIDEYDKCLELGFQGEMSKIVRRLPPLRNVILTSATSSAELPAFIDMAGAETIDNTSGSPVHTRLHIARVESPGRDKLDTLEQLLLSLPAGERAIIFVNHRESAERVFDRLHRDGFAAALYHGGLEQIDREQAVICLDNSTAPILVATDLAGRGLDIESVGSVIHYHLPPTAAAWTHRNGRTARVDARGKVYIITGPEESLPDYITWDNDLTPRPLRDTPDRPAMVTFHINAGRKEKISRGDIAGFLMKDAALPPDSIGKIDLRDHAAYVAVSRSSIPVISALAAPKIKNRRVRISRLK